jgi:hypothetical protein
VTLLCLLSDPETTVAECTLVTAPGGPVMTAVSARQPEPGGRL